MSTSDRILELEERLRELESDLHQVRDRYALATSAGRVGVWDWDLRTGRIHFDVGFRRLLGFGESEIGDDIENWVNRIHPEDRPGRDEALRRCLEDATRVLEAEYRVLAKDGSRRWIRSVGMVMRDERGRAVRISGTDTDVTERREAEERLREQTRFGQRLADKIPYIIYVFDLRSREVVYVNRELGAVLGHSPAEIERLGPGLVPSILHPEDSARLGELFEGWAEASDDDIHTGDYHVRDAQGTYRWFHARNVVFRRDPQDRPVQVLGTAIEITAQRKVEEERARLQRHVTRSARIEAVGTLAGGIAHEMNNVLGITMGHGQMGTLLEDLDPDAARNFEEIVKASKRGRDIVQRILRFSRHSESGRSRIDAASSVADVLRLLRPLLPDNVRVTEDLRAAGAIEIDPTELHQVLVNLCTNAAQAMEERGGRLLIGLEAVALRRDCPRGLPPGDYVRARVTDTGPGMDSAVLARALDPFFTTKPVGEGTGLGLSVADGIARDHGGAIVLASERGRGTTADLYLPRLEGVETEETAPAVAPLEPGTGRILFVDDEPSVIRITVQMLRSLGYEARGINRPTYALDVFRADPDAWDLVLTDENMPELRGHELVRELRRLRKDLPVLICTGHAEGVPRGALDTTDIRAVLRKPLLLEELERALRCALEAVPSR